MKYFALIFTFFLVSCAGAKLEETDNTLNLAIKKGFYKNVYKAKDFDLFAVYKMSNNPENKVLRVYIEGDGHAFASGGRISSDPTPHNPLALKLMLEDNSDVSKIYIGRPGQYIARYENVRKCNRKYWVNERFSQKVVDNLSELITNYKAKGGQAQIELVGFSGGGALAAILSAQRSDVLSLRTVAGNLDTVFFVKYHSVPEMKGSINPQTIKGDLNNKKLPQIHFAGSKDKIVPPEMINKFASNNECARVVILPEAKHSNIAVSYWNKLLSQKFTCH